MSASSASASAERPQSSEDEPPRLSALFLAQFDKRVGYTVSWKRSSVDVELDGAVEFKSFPSGLHAIKEDLVYFVHEGYAGLSAFCNAPASEQERNASFVAVGVLVPLSYGRLGRSWLHAPRLQTLAKQLATDPDDTESLERFWEEQSQSAESGSSSRLRPKGHSRPRALSTLTAVHPFDQDLPQFHPARCIVKYIRTFGPLIFRLQQAALLRKRILFVGAPPVRDACEFVYNLSVLSSIPNSIRELLPAGTDGLLRLRSLFSLGTHDIPLLERLSNPESDVSDSAEADFATQGWVACTTDEIIATKAKLYDIVVELPDPASPKPKWPSIRTSDGSYVKASQRDVRRYKVLHHELWKYRHSVPDENGSRGSDDDTRLLDPGECSDAEDEFNDSYDDTAVEPMTWLRLGYSGFMWWASAGERDAYTAEERDTDRELLGDLSDYHDGIHTAVIAAFHRWTVFLFTKLAGLVEAADDDEDADDEDAVVLDKDDISRIGLDTWSEADKAFIQEVLWMYFGRRADVHGTSVDCCGLKIPVF
ncbi:hypothetical protein M011DRAFT_398028 [Sporormia fimetaria CBS 119925]|uniref:DUF4484 domain-containing protein n=1 Tax=Sporormia fimetaria CBS 119925 TaxID=1340428 RepID=A0A6A6VGJ5_9PLEO|nr:hypothetical protein M011DRAFT_398028 [Sporormia fimetaria CBS 119925]